MINTLRNEVFNNDFNIYKKENIINVSGQKYDATYFFKTLNEDGKSKVFSKKFKGKINFKINEIISENEPMFNFVGIGQIKSGKFNKLTAAHCTSTEGIRLSVQADVDMIIHSVFKEPNGDNKFDNKTAELMASKGVYVNPTLHVFRSQIWEMQKSMVDKPENKEDVLALDSAKKEFDRRVDDLNKLIGFGAKVITGSDSSWGDYQLGNTVYEVECLELAGLSRSQSLKSVTRDSAISIGVDQSVGTLEKGKEADILVLEKDPYDDIDNLWRVQDVFLGGNILNRGSSNSLNSMRQFPPRA